MSTRVPVAVDTPAAIVINDAIVDGVFLLKRVCYRH